MDVWIMAIAKRIEVTNIEIERTGCFLNDRVSMEFSPSELSKLSQIFVDRALESDDYYDQGEERDWADRFQEAFEAWEKASEKAEKK